MSHTPVKDELIRELIVIVSELQEETNSFTKFSPGLLKWVIDEYNTRELIEDGKSKNNSLRQLDGETLMLEKCIHCGLPYIKTNCDLNMLRHSSCFKKTRFATWLLRLKSISAKFNVSPYTLINILFFTNCIEPYELDPKNLFEFAEANDFSFVLFAPDHPGNKWAQGMNIEKVLEC